MLRRVGFLARRPVVEQRHGLSPSGDGGNACLLKRLSKRRHQQITATREQVAAPHSIESLRAEAAQKTQLEAVIAIGLNAVAARVGACGERRAVHLRGADEHRMMAAEESSIRRQLIKRGAILWRDEIG